MGEIIVSTIMITYNHEAFIDDAIKSVLDQKTNFNVELIIAEDCSTDNTRKICEKYAEQFPNKIKLVLSSVNIGANANFFQAYRIAGGKYIALCEGDDYWIDKNKLQKQVDFLNDNPDFGIVHTDVDMFYESTGKITRNYNRENKITIPDGFVFDYLIVPLYPLFIKTATACFRREIADKYLDINVVLERKWKLGDLPLWLDISKHSKVHYLPESTAIYRLLNESASRSRNPQKMFEFHQSLYDVFEYYCTKYKINDIVKHKIEIQKNITLLSDGYNLFDSVITKLAYDFLIKNEVHITNKQFLYYILNKYKLFRFFRKSLNFNR
jgi:glycosyltransferase involved in cell wall biosynthesis